MLVRCTARLLGVLGRGVDLLDEPPSDDDWYANLLWIERRKCLLVTHAGTLFPVFVANVRKADLVPLGALVAGHAAMALSDERLPDDILGVLDPGSARVARTASRRILSFMNDSARACRYAVEDSGGLEHTDLDDLNRRLRRQLHDHDGYRQPLDSVLDRLAA